MNKWIITALFFFSSINIYAQSQIEEDQLGAWYMYFYTEQFGDSSFGIQGDIQYRNWNILGDLEQLLLRSGFTYKPKNANVLFTLGYGNISTGEFGDGDSKVIENRIYQEALLPHKVGNKVYLTHRFRYEQRWVENQDIRTRYRYNLFVNIPLNKPSLEKGAFYIALYNELFINGQTEIGQGRTVQFFDRNRTYLGLGHNLKDKVRVQLGWMKQTTVNWSKGQAQVSLHHSW